MDDAWFAERAEARERRAEERARRRAEDAKFLADFERRSDERQEKREARDDMLQRVEAEVRVKAAARAAGGGARADANDGSASSASAALQAEAAARRREQEEAEAARERQRAAEREKREAERVAAREALEREEERRLQKEADRRAAREQAERAAEAERLQLEAQREAQRQAKLLAQKEAAAEEEKRRAEAAAAAAEAKRLAEAEAKAAAELKAKQEAEAADRRRAEAELKRQEREAEDARLAAEAEAAAEKRRQEREAAQQKRLAEEEAEKKRLEDEKAEKARLDAQAAADAEAAAKAAADLKKKQDEEEAEKKRLEDEKAEKARLDAQAAADAEAAVKAAADLKKKQDEEEAEKKRLEDEKAEKARLDVQAAADAEAAAIAAEQAAADLKKKQDEEEAEKKRVQAEKEAEELRLAVEAEEAAAVAALEAEQQAARKKIDEEAEARRKQLEEEEEILRADEARLAAEEAALAADKSESEIDDEEAELLAEEEALRLEEEAMKKAEEEERAENARLLAEEEAQIAREEAEFEALMAKQKEDEAARKEAQAKAEAEENARIEAELLREDAERAAAEEAKKVEEAAKKAEADAAAEAAAKKKADEDAAAAAAVPEPSATVAPAASKKAAFLAALNNKIGLGGPPPKVKPAPVEEPATAAPTSQNDANTSNANVLEGDAGAAGPRLTHLTQQRAKGPNRKHRATMAGIKSRMDADGTASFFVGEVQATPHVEGQTGTDAGSSSSAAADGESTPAAEPVKKLPPGAKGMPGMSMGGLMAAIKKSEQRRSSVSSSDAPAAAEAKLPPLRLIQVRGKAKEIMVRLVEPVLAGLSHDSAFILEDVKAAKLFVWSGYNANKMQTTKCLDLVNRINRGEHGGRATSTTFRAGEEPKEFWNLLGVEAPTPTTAKSVSQTNNLPNAVDTLYRLDPTETGFALIELASEFKNLERGLLWSDACYLLDSGYEVRTWIGKTSPKEMREAIMSQATELLQKPTKEGNARPAWAQFVYKETDRAETALFSDKFASWPAEYKPKVAAAPPSRARAASASPSVQASQNGTASPQAASSPSKPRNSRMVPYEGSTMAAIERPASADKVLPDDGVHGGIKAWVQEGFEKKPLPKNRIGIYEDTHCYLELYTWGMVGSERHMVYFWQGQATSPNDQGSVAGLAREVNERICKGSGQLVRVPQYHESEHFLLSHAMQQQPYVSLGASLNGAANGNVVRFIQVRGKDANWTKAHQVAVDSSLLNTNDAFILITDSGNVSPADDAEAPYLANVKEVSIWQGKNSSKFVREYAQQLVKRLAGASATVATIEEGSEPAAFWSTLGKPTEYTTTLQTDFSLKIYMCTASSQDGFKIGRIWDYSNADICSDRVLIIEDSQHHLYVWMGARTAEPERKLALESSLSYAQTVASPTSPVYMYEGHETLPFKALFHGWTAKPKLDTKSVAGSGHVADLLPQYAATYSLSQLKDRSALPPTVDQANLEYHLNASDFPEALKMTQEAFFALPEWKRLEAKKSSPIY